MQSVIFRALATILIGLLLVTFPAETVSIWLVRIVGALFMIPGLVSWGTYFMSFAKQDAIRDFLPIVGVGSVLLGGMMLAVPEIFVKVLMYVLAGFLLLAGISSLINNVRIRRLRQVGYIFYVVPVLICMVGLLIIIHPWEALTIPFVVFGTASIVYGLFELVYAVHFRKVFKEIGKSTEGTESTESIESIESTESTERTESIESAESAESTESTESTVQD